MDIPKYYWPHQKAKDAAKAHPVSCECVCCVERRVKIKAIEFRFRRALKALKDQTYLPTAGALQDLTFKEAIPPSDGRYFIKINTPLPDLPGDG